jgi:hypothetical protein
MSIARCKVDGCSWEQYRDTETAALTLLRHHEAFRHPDIYGAETNQAPPERVVQLADVDWWTQAIDAIAAQPAKRRFTIYEVCAHLDEPPTGNGWQNLTRDAHHLGLIEKVGGVESKRPGTRQSMTGLWERTEKRAPTAERTQTA